MPRNARRRVSRPLAFAAMVAAVVVLPARSVSGQEATLQGERLSVGAVSGRVVREDGRRALRLTGGGIARGRARATRASRLAIVVRGTACAGAPRIAVTVDGAPVLSDAVRAARRWTTIPIGGSVPPGTHELAVRLTNPGRTRRCRRALYVDRLVLRPTVASAPAPAAIWRPPPGVTWQWQLTGRLDLDVDAALYDVDLFDTSAATVADLHRRGRHVVCYLDAGTYEPGRPDSAAYPAAVRGAAVEGWPGERWLDIRRLDVLGPLIERRLDLCHAKGFDGVEPDNLDAYANKSGFPLSGADQLAFNRFVATAAHARGLSVGLKNDLGQAATLQSAFDWALDEQCYQYDECDLLRPFARAGKAVLVAEYELAPQAFCDAARAAGYSAIRKRLDLGAWREACQ